MAPSLGSTRRVIVIGAGIVGAAAANFLRRDGHGVTLVDASDPGEGCSYGNAGLISPDMCVPAALPGMLRKLPGWLADPRGPLAIRWAYLPWATPWLLRWARAGRMAQVELSAAALRLLHARSFEGYEELLGGAGMADLIRRTGQLYLWESEERSEAERIAAALRDQLGVRTHAIGAEEIRQMAPEVSPRFKRGLFFPDNGNTVNPQRLVRTLADRLGQAGGAVVRARVLDIDVGAEGVRAVVTDRGAIAADAVVVAAGAWSNRLLTKFGLRLPLETERGYHVMLPTPGLRPRLALSHRNQMFGLTPMEHGLRVAGTVEIAGLDAPMDENRARLLLRQVQAMLPGVDIAGAQFWMGHRPSFPDSLPVIDRMPGCPSVFLAFGNGHTGMTGAPMTGRLVADLVAGRAPTIDPSPFRADRF